MGRMEKLTLLSIALIAASIFALPIVISESWGHYWFVSLVIIFFIIFAVVIVAIK